VSGGIAQLFLNLGTRRGCVVSITPRQPLPPGNTQYPLHRRLVWIGAENLAPPGFDPLTFEPVASRFTDYSIRALESGRTPSKYHMSQETEEVKVWVGEAAISTPIHLTALIQY
jgi:hypothetical protein